jgi:hypothetical protein
VKKPNCTKYGFLQVHFNRPAVESELAEIQTFAAVRDRSYSGILSGL